MNSDKGTVINNINWFGELTILNTNNETENCLFIYLTKNGDVALYVPSLKQILIIDSDMYYSNTKLEDLKIFRKHNISNEIKDSEDLENELTELGYAF